MWLTRYYQLTDNIILDGFHGDVYLLIKLLLPGVSKRVYNLQSKQIVKLLSQVFQCSVDDMIEDLDHVSSYADIN